MRRHRHGFIGLGVMGFPMAGASPAGRARGHGVQPDLLELTHGSNSTAAHWRTPANAAEGAEVVITIVGNDDDVRSVVYGDDGALDAMANGSVLIDHTTASAALARELGDACVARGVGFVDGPVSGGQAGAENGRLTVMCGGEAETFESVAPLLETYAINATLIGPVGSGQLTKMVNQIAIAGTLQGLSEGLHLAMLAGLDTDRVLATISKGAAGSWQMDNRGTTMVEGSFDFGFAVDWMRKDLGIALDEGNARGASLPVAALVDQFYARVQARGGNRWDTSSLIDLLQNP
ncbi:MAG: NAD(P)-dependent oxidoreductase [Acidimicrobiales bacterium]